MRVVKRIFQRLQDKGIIYREGSRKKKDYGNLKKINEILQLWQERKFEKMI